jgi:uncharacterized membrane protein YdjX (TVP38/TMEM64 family)
MKWVAAIVVVGALLAVGLSSAVQDALLDAAAWCATAGALGILVYGALYTLSTLLVIPAAILTAAAGWAWGLWEGTLIVLGVSLIADWIPFAIARRLGRARVEAAAQHRKTLRALDEAFATHGFLLVALLRLSPIAPYNVTNYLLGLVPVSTFTYLTASTIGCLPGCVLIVYAGTLIPHGERLGTVPIFDDPWVIAASLVIAIGGYLAVTLIARRALRRIVDK